MGSEGRDRGVLRWARHGEDAVAALAAAVDEAQAPDRLAPVTVVAPSAHAGTALRRRLARRRGVLGVSFLSLPQLVDILAGPGAGRDAGPEAVAGAVRGALDTCPGGLAVAAGHQVTEDAVARTLAELRHLAPADLDALAGAGGLTGDLVALHHEVWRRLGPVGDAVARSQSATVAADAGGRPVDRVGHVVVHLPWRLRPAEVDLLAALHRRGRLTVLLGCTGVASADAPSDELAARLGAALGVPVPAGHDPAALEVARRSATGPPLNGDRGDAWGSGGAWGGGGAGPAAPWRVVRAPDPEEEVRVAVRSVLEALADGVHPDEVAVAFRVDDPYLLLVHEELEAAGIDHHGPSPLRLGQTGAGLALRGMLGLAADGLPRNDLVRWLRAVEVRHDGRGVAAHVVDRVARAAGVASGDQWAPRLATLERARCDELEERRRRALEEDEVAAAAGRPADDRPVEERPWVARARQRLDEVTTVRAVVTDLAAALAPPPSPTTWAELAAWATGALARWVPEAVPDGTTDVAADVAAVASVLDQVGRLDGIDEPPDLARFVRAVVAALDRPGPPVGHFGRGVFVGPVAEVVGASHQLVVVLGMAEGVFPPSGQDDPLLPDVVRRRLGGRLAPRRRSRAQEHHDLLGALATAPRRLVAFARTDTRAGRERLPARWWLDVVTDLVSPGGAPTRVAPDDLDGLDAAPWWVDVASFAQVGRTGPGLRAAALDATEWDLAQLAAERSTTAHHRLDVLPAVAGIRPGLAAGLPVAEARLAGRFTPWTGDVGPIDGVGFADGGLGSATSLEGYATCPFRYFLRNVLGVAAPDEQADEEAVSALDWGSLVHRVLEEYVADGGPVAPVDDERLDGVLAEATGAVEGVGRGGRPLRWRLSTEELGLLVRRTLAADARHRHEADMAPVLVEMPFGMDLPDRTGAVAPPVEVELADGRVVRFRGFIDRIDTTADGRRALVIDYKTGGARDYAGLEADPPDLTCRGRHLQLTLYALAAETRLGTDEVAACYWFVSGALGRGGMARGGVVDAGARLRLRQVLGTLVDGVDAGRFPARPGDETFRPGVGVFHEHCRYCDYDRLCPVSRGEQWETVRLTPRLAPYVDLAEGPWPPAEVVP